MEKKEKITAKNVRIEMADNGGVKVCYDAPEGKSGDKHSARRMMPKEEIFSKEDAEKALARMQELKGIEATDKGVEEKGEGSEEEERQESPQEEQQEQEEGGESGEGGAMEEKPSAMGENKVRLPHEENDEEEEEY
jgi:hypothetical protein